MSARKHRRRQPIRLAGGGAMAMTTAGNLIILTGHALAGVVSARALGPAGRGQVAIAVLWSALIHLVGSVGLQSSCSYYAASRPSMRAGLAAWALRVGARQAAAMTVASVLIFGWLLLRLHLPWALAAEYVTWAAAGTLALYGVGYAQGCGDFRWFNLLRLISGAGPTPLMLATAAAVRLTPTEAGAAYLIPTWCAAGLAVVRLSRATRASGPGRSPLSRRERRRLRSYGWRSLASLASLALNNSSDQLVLGLLAPVSSVGVYAVAASSAAPLATVLASIGMVGLPAVAALSGPEKGTASWSALRRAVAFLVLAAPLLAALLPWAIPLVYGSRYAAAVGPAEILVAGWTFAALATVTDDLLRGHGRPGFVSVSQGAGGILTIVGMLLIGGHTLVGVAVASSVGFALSFALALLRLKALARTAPARPAVGQARPAAP